MAKKHLILFFIVLVQSTYMMAQDVGVTAITTPQSGCMLTATETVTIDIYNYGSAIVSPFNISYIADGGATVTESVSSISILTPFLGGATLSYTFTTKADVSIPGPHTIKAFSSIGGDTDNSNDSINVNITSSPNSVGGTISGNTTVCSGTNSGILTLNGRTGAVLRWEYSTDGGSTWNNIANTTSSLNYNNLTSTTDYKALVQSGTCAVVYSSVGNIPVSPVSVGGNVTNNDTVCASANTGTLNLSGHTGNIVQWEFSTDGGSTWTTITNTTTSQTYINLNITTSYKALVQSSPCVSAYSSTATITVDPISVGGSLSGSTTVCSYSNSGSITLSGHTGNIIRWEYSTDGGTTWTNIANTTTSETYNNLSTTTIYQAIVQNGVCNATYSAPATITVNTPTVGGTTSGSTYVRHQTVVLLP